MEKIINDLVELSQDGKKAMLVSFKNKCDKDGRLQITINEVWDRVLIDNDSILGEIDLTVYKTYEEIKEELIYLLNV